MRRRLWKEDRTLDVILKNPLGERMKRRTVPFTSGLSSEFFSS
jgi:hypothetical protein